MIWSKMWLPSTVPLDGAAVSLLCPSSMGHFGSHSPTGVRMPGHLCLLMVQTQWSHSPFFPLSTIVHRDMCLIVNMAMLFSILQITAMLLGQSKASYFELATPY